jgi:hypothetical protein
LLMLAGGGGGGGGGDHTLGLQIGPSLGHEIGPTLGPEILSDGALLWDTLRADLCSKSVQDKRPLVETLASFVRSSRMPQKPMVAPPAASSRTTTAARCAAPRRLIDHIVEVPMTTFAHETASLALRSDARRRLVLPSPPPVVVSLRRSTPSGMVSHIGKTLCDEIGKTLCDETGDNQSARLLNSSAKCKECDWKSEPQNGLAGQAGSGSGSGSGLGPNITDLERAPPHKRRRLADAADDPPAHTGVPINLTSPAGAPPITMILPVAHPPLNVPAFADKVGKPGGRADGGALLPWRGWTLSVDANCFCRKRRLKRCLSCWLATREALPGPPKRPRKLYVPSSRAIAQAPRAAQFLVSSLWRPSPFILQNIH